MGFLGFALKCFDVLAWPLISLGYPLCASVRAIEFNSNSDMKKLITYWILYSLISLFELGFSKLIEWIPFWPCVKLTAIFYLVLPRFHGAYHVYGCLVHPYFHMNPQVVINKFNKLKELSHNGENFLAMVDKYVEENGLEALVKLIASKSKGTKPSYDVEEIKAVANTEKKEVAASIQSKWEDPIVFQKDIKAVEQTEKNAAAAAKVKHGESNLAHAAEEITVAAVKIEEITATSVAGGENKLPEKTTSKEVQKEWTCAVCQLTCHSEKILNSHLQGKKHRAKCKEHGESNLAHAAEEITVAAVMIEEITAKSVAGGENKLPEITTSKEVQKEWTCTACQLTCHSEKILNSHLQGKKHRGKSKEHGESNLAHAAEEITVAAVKIEEITAKSVAGGENKLPEITTSKEVQKEWTCDVCQLTCYSEKILNSHLQGKKHRAKCKEHGESNLAHAAEEITVAAVQIEEITAKSVAGGENKLPEITTSKVVQKEWTCAVCQLTCHSEKILNSHLQGKKHRAKCKEHGESNLAHAAEEITVAAVQIEEITAKSVAGGENKLPEITTSKEVQKEWTCAVCQLTCHSEKILNSHLQGKKHRGKCKEHGESNLAHAAEEITVAAVQIEEITAKSVAGGENKLPEITTSKEVQKEWTCAVCQLTCHSEKILNSHLQGKKHRAKCKECGESNLAHAAEEITVAAVKIEEITAKSVAGGENKLPEITTSKEVQKEWTCAVCQLTCHSEKNLNSHLQGEKHKAKCEELNASKQTDKNLGSPFEAGNISDQSNQEPRNSRRSRKRNRKNAGTEM